MLFRKERALTSKLELLLTHRTDATYRPAKQKTFQLCVWFGLEIPRVLI
jgi:hypothetical protein